MRARGSIDFEAMILVEMVKADQRVLAVEEVTAVEAMEESGGQSASERFVAAMQAENDLTALEVLSAISNDLSLEEKMELLRNCWRVAVSDSELHVAEEKLIYNIVDELRISRREFTEQQQRMAG